MGWFSDVADILEQRGHFQVVAHDGTRFREVDELESECDALAAEVERLREAITVSTDVIKRLYRGIDEYYLSCTPGLQESTEKRIVSNMELLKGATMQAQHERKVMNDE